MTHFTKNLITLAGYLVIVVISFLPDDEEETENPQRKEPDALDQDNDLDGAHRARSPRRSGTHPVDPAVRGRTERLTPPPAAADDSPAPTAEPSPLAPTPTKED